MLYRELAVWSRKESRKKKGKARRRNQFFRSRAGVSIVGEGGKTEEEKGSSALFFLCSMGAAKRKKGKKKEGGNFRARDYGPSIGRIGWRKKKTEDACWKKGGGKERVRFRPAPCFAWFFERRKKGKKDRKAISRRLSTSSTKRRNSK